MVLRPLLLTQNRIEAFRVKIAVVDLVASRPQGLDDLAMQSRAEAGDDWIGIYNQDSQRRSPSSAAARWSCANRGSKL